MREDDSNWFDKCQEKLPTEDELIPLSQPLIPPDLAKAFGVPSLILPPPLPPPMLQATTSHLPNSSNNHPADFDSGAGGDEPANTLKRPRLVWTPQLHKRFVEVVAYLGTKNAVPNTIMQMMNVDGLTRENVASHLQRYRLHGLSNSNSRGAGAEGFPATGDPATNHLFSSSPVPAHSLHPTTGRPNSDNFMPVASLQQHHQHMAAPATPVAGQHYYMQMNGQLVHQFLNRPSSQGARMVGGGIHNSISSLPSLYTDDFNSRS